VTWEREKVTGAEVMPVWCQKRIEANRRGIAVFVRVEEELYEGDLGAYKAICGAREGDGSRGAAAAVSVPGGVGRRVGRRQRARAMEGED
jgi:hypothetical protein